MNPFFNQQQLNQQLSQGLNQQLPQGFNQQANFQGVGNLGVQNPFQQAWSQQGLIAMQPQMQQPMQPYQYPYQAAQLAYQMPTQQMQNFAAAQMPQQGKNQNNAPPLPKTDQPLHQYLNLRSYHLLKILQSPLPHLLRNPELNLHKISKLEKNRK